MSAVDVPDDDVGPELWQTVQPHHRDDVDAMPGPIVEAIRDRTGGVETDDDGLPTTGTWKDAMLPEQILPGFGENMDGWPTNAQDDCGDDLPHACEDCGNVVSIGSTCSQSTCARCATNWCRERASDWTGRIMQAKAFRWGITGQDQHLHHTVVSPPDNWTSDSPREDGREIVQAIMDEINMEGVAIYHPFRGAEEATDENEDLHQADKPGDLNEWKDRLFEGRRFDDIRDELRWSPHWHLVGVGGWQRGGDLTTAVEDATGWVIHRITPDGQTYSIRDENQLARVLSYCFSHAGIRETSQGFRVESTFKKDWMDEPNFEVAEETEALADALVREEAWKVLGIPSAAMTCLEIEEPDADECDCGDCDDVARIDPSGGGEGDGGDGRDRADADDDADLDVRCRGGLRAIDEWDHDRGCLWWEARLDDDDWRADADNDAEVAEALAKWRLEHYEPPD